MTDRIPNADSLPHWSPSGCVLIVLFACACVACLFSSSPGHFGHIELVKPCLHIGLMPIIAKILKCVCFYCSSLLLSEDNPKYHHVMRIKKPAKRLQAMLKVCQGMKKCNGGFDVDASALADEAERERNGGGALGDDGVPRKSKTKSSGCGNILPRYKVESGYEVLIEFPEEADAMLEGSVDRKKPLSASRIHEIFKRISDDDVRALGFDPHFARPDWFIITVLAVPPPPVRPSVMFASSARSSDDLTYKVRQRQSPRKQRAQLAQLGAWLLICSSFCLLCGSIDCSWLISSRRTKPCVHRSFKVPPSTSCWTTLVCCSGTWPR